MSGYFFHPEFSVGSLAAFSHENQLGSANRRTAEARGERPLNSWSGQIEKHQAVLILTWQS